MITQRIIKSFVRYAMVGVSASLTTYLMSKGVDVEDVKQLTDLLEALAPALLAIMWSVGKNSKEVKEVKELKGNDHAKNLNP